MCLSGALVGGYVSGDRICSWCVVYSWWCVVYSWWCLVYSWWYLYEE